MPPPRPATEARSGSLEPGRPSRARSANTRHPAGRPHTPPADWMYATDVRQTDVRQHHHLMPPGRGHNNRGRRPTVIFSEYFTWDKMEEMNLRNPTFSVCLDRPTGYIACNIKFW